MESSFNNFHWLVFTFYTKYSVTPCPDDTFGTRYTAFQVLLTAHVTLRQFDQENNFGCIGVICLNGELRVSVLRFIWYGSTVPVMVPVVPV